MQLTSKEAKGKTLQPEENDLKKEVLALVECSPVSRETSGIYSWRIKSLKKILENKVVFWTNSEDKLPCGSVADKSTKDTPAGGILDNGGGNEIIEYVAPRYRLSFSLCVVSPSLYVLACRTRLPS